MILLVQQCEELHSGSPSNGYLTDFSETITQVNVMCVHGCVTVLAKTTRSSATTEIACLSSHYVTQGHRFWYQSKARDQFFISE